MRTGQSISDAKAHETWNNAAEESFQRIKRELCEAPLLGMPTESNVRTGH